MRVKVAAVCAAIAWSAACGDLSSPVAPGVSPPGSSQTPRAGATGFSEPLEGTIRYVNEGPAAGIPVTTMIETIVQQSPTSFRYFYRDGPSGVTDGAGRFFIQGQQHLDLPQGSQWLLIYPGGRSAIGFPREVRRPLASAYAPTYDVGPVRLQRPMSVTVGTPLEFTLSNDNVPIIGDYECDPCASVTVHLPAGRASQLQARWTGGDAIGFGFSRAADYIYADPITLGYYRASPGDGRLDVALPLSWQAGATPLELGVLVGLPIGSRAKGGIAAPLQVTLAVQPID